MSARACLNKRSPRRPLPLACVRLVGLLALLATVFGMPEMNRSHGVRAEEEAAQYWVYFGTYTHGGKSQGIYVSRLDVQSGRLSSPVLAARVVNPSFLAIAPNRRFLYCVTEIGSYQKKRTGAVAAFALNRQNGSLEELNRQPSGGAGPCHLVVDATGRNVLVANYGGGSVAVLPVDELGRLKKPSCVIQHRGSSVNPRRQKGPHAHSINLDRNNRFAFAADLGLDKVLIYRFDPQAGTLEPNDPPFAKMAPGSGPRHFAFHPNGRFAYVINEMLCTVTAMRYAPATGALEPFQTVDTLPRPRQSGDSTAEVQVHPSGKFLYGSNRGHDSIVIFRIDPTSGRLTLVGHEPTRGKTPRNFGLDPTGRWLFACNQNSDTVVVFRIDQQTGRLQPTGQVLQVPVPVCVKCVPVQP